MCYFKTSITYDAINVRISLRDVSNNLMQFRSFYVEKTNKNHEAQP